MLRVFIVITVLLSAVPAVAGMEWRWSNTNYLFSGSDVTTDKQYQMDYNRLRLKAVYTGRSVDFTVIADNENLYGKAFLQSTMYLVERNTPLDLPFSPYNYLSESDTNVNRMYLYRMYMDIHMPNGVATLGFQRVPFGIGRVWTPTDIFNPVNPLAVEKDERLGVAALQYTYYFGNSGRMQMIGNARDDWEADKVGFRAKSMLLGMDAGISYITSDRINMYGVEAEGNLFDTGIALWLEGGRFVVQNPNVDFVRWVAGAEYGFTNGFTVITEYLYNGNGATDRTEYFLYVPDETDFTFLASRYLAFTFSQEITPLLRGSLGYIRNLRDGSAVYTPELAYSLSNHTDIRLGGQVYTGDTLDEFQADRELYYLNLSVYF